MSAPHPDTIAKALHHLGSQSVFLSDEYRWLYPSAHNRTARGSVSRGGTTHEDGSPSNVSDLLAATSSNRRDITNAGIAILEAVSDIHRAVILLGHVRESIDHTAPVEASVHERAVEHPADRGDVQRARAAQKRRERRMDGKVLPWSADEVTG
jgi:hypothetical protein